MNLLTIDLEKALIKQNKSVVTSKELLEVMEFERRGELLQSKSLDRMGITNALKEGKAIKSRVDTNKEQTLKFDQSRVFHISQIEKTCNKYYLRFLPTAYYKGTLDEKLPFKVATFELAHGVELESYQDYDSLGMQFYYDMLNRKQEKQKVNNSYIMAPKESFNLEQRPKDPLLFYKINDEYFYLIHKWGNDLSIARRLKSISSHRGSFFYCLLTILLLSAFLLPSVVGIILVVIFGAMTLVSGIMWSCGDPMILSKENDWDSKYI